MSPDRPRVSVCTTTYNQAAFIVEAMESALGQQTDFDFEMVVVDDASSDETPELLRALMEAHPDTMRVTLNESNLGASANFRKAMELCRGEYLALLDGDDVWTDPSKLQRQVDFLDAHPECGLCGHRVRIIEEDGSQVSRSDGSGETWPTPRPEVSGIEDLIRENFLPSVAMMYRHPGMGFFPEWYDTVVCSDWCFHLLNAERGKIGFINEVLASHRLRSGSLWNARPTSARLAEEIYACRMLEGRLDQRYRAAMRNKRAELFEKYGWWAFRKSRRGRAFSCGLRSVVTRPWRQGGWRLLACSVLKRARDDSGDGVTHVS